MLLFEEESSVKKIEEVIKSLQPGFAANGGEINFIKYECNVLYINFAGSYLGYPSDVKSTLKMVEREVRMAVPEVERVESL